MADQGTSTTDSLQKLKDWIDDPQTSGLKGRETPRFLIKSEFDMDILKKGLIYAMDQLKSVGEKCAVLEQVAGQYPDKIDMNFWIKEFDLDDPKNLCLINETSSNNYAERIRSADPSRLQNIRRTVGAVAILTKKWEEKSGDFAREIARKGQGDI